MLLSREKIGLNRRLNDNLEAMAQALYDYWFVQFDFPDENGKPYKSSGGKMVWNEVLKREIPEGWGIDNITAIANIEAGGTPSTQEASYWDGSIPFYTPKDASEGFIAPSKTVRNTTTSGVENSSTQIFTKAVFLTARGTVGRVQMPRIAMAMNQSCYALCPKESISLFYLFFVVRSIVKALKVKANGAVFDAIVTRDILSIHLPQAQFSVIELFTERVTPILLRIIATQSELEELTKQRDFLLPLLMNGQVQVKPQGGLNYHLSDD